MTALAVFAFVLAALFDADTNLTMFFLHRQDRWILAAGAASLALCFWRLRPCETEFSGKWHLALLGGGAMALVAFAGHYLVLSGYDLSRDEQMATFDAAVFANGQLVAPLPPMWRDHADALNTMYMYPSEHYGAWISAYLPLNAALRTLTGLVASPVLVGPLMILLGALALWGCVRRLWPAEGELPVVAMLFYLGSAQILVNGMTAYAMPAHLTLNLCWLWLYLRRNWRADFAALAVGFVTVGLHQPLMHPLFVGPILFLLLLEKNWRRAAFFAGGYAAICLFWMWWPNWTWTLVQADMLATKPAGVDYLTRLLQAVANGGVMALPNMMANLLRFIAWQHFLLVPLLIAGIRIARADRLASALLAGVILTVCVMSVILPYQGHGFGYRYLHGLIGAAILLAIFGWRSLGDRKAMWRALLIRTSVTGLLLILPLQLWMAHNFYAPFARVSSLIDESGFDYVVIGANDAPFSGDLVINSPYLDRHPVRLLKQQVNVALAQSICAKRPSIALMQSKFLEPVHSYFDLPPSSSMTRSNREIATLFAKAGCRVGSLG